MQCNTMGCGQHVVFHIASATNRRLVHEYYFCGQHGRMFLDNYRSESHRGTGLLGKSIGAICFDVELLIFEESGFYQIYLREVEGNRLFALKLGYFEISALHNALKGVPSLRPMTHETMATFIKLLGGKVENVLLDRWNDEGQFISATLPVRKGDTLINCDLRPSDGIILAIYCNVPIFVLEHLLARNNKGEPKGDSSKEKGKEKWEAVIRERNSDNSNSHLNEGHN
jgi:bifunctional DNase/RNase